jgi:hypothetical protein
MSDHPEPPPMRVVWRGGLFGNVMGQERMVKRSVLDRWDRRFAGRQPSFLLRKGALLRRALCALRRWL